MGRITQLISAGAKAQPAPRQAPGKAGPGQGRSTQSSRSVWRDIFRGTDKERDRAAPRQRPQGLDGISASTANATARLIQALRTNAPGAPSDDRWEQVRHYFGIVFVSIFNLCRQMSRCEFQVYRKDDSLPDGKRPLKKGEEGWDLVRLLERPNRQDSWGKFIFRTVQQKLLTGTAFTLMVPNKLGTPMELYNIPTPLAIAQPAVNPDYPEGFYRIQPVYPYGPFSSYPVPTSAVGAPIPAQWMMRMSYPHPLLRYDGWSHLTALRQDIDAFEMIGRSRHYSMRRAINPSAKLTFKDLESGQPIPEEEVNRLRAEFENDAMGPENWGRLLVAAAGGDLEPWGANPVDMAYEHGWDQLSSFLMGAFGITKPAAGMVEDSSYATLFATLKQLHMIFMEPECDDISADLNMQLAPFFGDDLVVEVRTRRIDDHELKLQKIDKLCQYSAITYNQLLKEMDMPTTDEEWGAERVGRDQPEAAPGMPGVPGAPQSPVDALMAGAGGDGEGRDEEEPQPPEVEASRPGPGQLSRGSANPRGPKEKALDERKSALVKALRRMDVEARRKSFYEKALARFSNGHH